VIQVFLVTTFTSGAAAVARKIAQDPTSLPTRLAKNLPKASNFYLTYFILQGTASAAKNVLNYGDLLEYLGYDRFFDKTPRAKYNRYAQMKGISWGSVYPKFANMAIIGTSLPERTRDTRPTLTDHLAAIAYACIAPLVLGFATIGIFLYYLSYRYNLLFVVQTKFDTKGESYTRALQHLLTGVYLSELCLIGLFGLRKAPGPSLLMAILFVITILYHVTMNRHLSPLEEYLPADLQAEDEERPLLEAEQGSSPDDGDTLPESLIEQIGRGRVPTQVLKPVAQFLEPEVFASHQALKSWFQDVEEDLPQYSDEEIRTAYLNPALSSKTPKLWLVRDEMGISKHEIAENEAAGIPSTDEGAFLDENNDIVWPVDDLTKAPIFKMPVRY
jgi:calcium permeable stress-gated cation channel